MGLSFGAITTADGKTVGGYATAWYVVQSSDKFTRVNISISKKGQDGNYKTDWSGIMTFIGKAKSKIDSMNLPTDKEHKSATRIRIRNGEVTTTYDKAKNANYTNYAVFDFEEMGESNSRHVANAPVSAYVPDEVMSIPDGADDEGLPFN